MARIDSADLARIVTGIRDRFPLSGVALKAGVKLQRAGREWKGCCPFHPDNSPSFTIYADDRRAHCFGCGWTGDVLDLVQQAYGVKLPAAIEMLDGGALRDLEQQMAPAKPKVDLRPLIGRILGGASAIEGTPAEAYLRGRGITIPLPASLRFARLPPPKIEDNGVLMANGPAPLPTMIAVVSDHAGGVVGIQRTYLTDDGRKAATTDPKGKVKYSLGDVMGGAIRLGAVISEGLAICEGIEDALSLIEMGAASAWAAAGTSMLPALRFPDEVRSVVIGGDANPAGRVAAAKAAEAYAQGGRDVRVIYPTPPFADFNDELREQAA
jgi:DNA primase